jgi:hypothetical protein
MRLLLNVDQEAIVLSKDRLELRLLKFLPRLRNLRELLTLLGVLATSLGALVTSKFQDVWLSAAAWRYTYVLFSLGSLIGLVSTIIKLFRSKTHEQFIEELVSESVKGAKIYVEPITEDNLRMDDFPPK